MKTCVIAIILCLSGICLKGQAFSFPDTLLSEYFETDPTPDMAQVPTGDDPNWVNYDGDGIPSLCIDVPLPLPSAWFWDGDLGVMNPQDSNYAFTSCSFLTEPSEKNYNWLITSPIMIPDTSYWLCWRSLSYYGPGYLDGYKVLVADSINGPALNVFKDTLFVAAEMLEDSEPTGSLDVNDYVFSEGYIHANGYTDPAYFFEDNSQGPPFLHGKLEPHAVSLSAYANKKIYIAFLHDSQDDFILQIDNIIVSKNHLVATAAPENVLFLDVIPNPVRDAAYLSWKTGTPQEGRLIVTDNMGKLVTQQSFGSRAEGQIFLQAYNWVPGIYYCTLETAAGHATTKLVKW